MKILITGGSGLLGQYLNVKLSGDNEILSLYNKNPGNCKNYASKEIDLSNKEKLDEIFITFNPDVVIHTAAISRPELCDSLPSEYVKEININATEHLAELCARYNSKLIFTSTDLVYDGDSGGMMSEEDLVNPVSFYAETKIMSEDIIRNTFDNFIILRTSLLFGMGMNHSLNNFHNMILSFRKNKKVKLFYDQFRTPLSLIDASEIISQLLNNNIRNITINFGGMERISRTELGEIVCRAGGFDTSLIERTSMYDIPDLHKVADVSMNTDKLNSLVIKRNSPEESVTQILKDLF